MRRCEALALQEGDLVDVSGLPAGKAGAVGLLGRSASRPVGVVWAMWFARRAARLNCSRRYGAVATVATVVATVVAVVELISKTNWHLFLGRFATRACRADAP